MKKEDFEKNYNAFLKDIKRMTEFNYRIVRTSIRNFIIRNGIIFNESQKNKMNILYEICLG